MILAYYLIYVALYFIMYWLQCCVRGVSTVVTKLTMIAHTISILLVATSIDMCCCLYGSDIWGHCRHIWQFTLHCVHNFV